MALIYSKKHFWLTSIVVIMTVIGLMALTHSVFAQGEGYKIQVGIPGFPKESAPGLKEYIEALYKLVLGLVVIGALLGLIIGGVLYVASGVSTSAKQEARARIQSAIVGLLLVLFATVLLRTLSGSFSSIVIPIPQVVTLPKGISAVGLSQQWPGDPTGATGPGVSAQNQQLIQECVSGQCTGIPLGSTYQGFIMESSACTANGTPTGNQCYLRQQTINALKGLEGAASGQSMVIEVSGATSDTMSFGHISTEHYNGCAADIQFTNLSSDIGKACQQIEAVVQDAKNKGYRVANGYLLNSAQLGGQRCGSSNASPDPGANHLHIGIPNCP